jgi:F-type H+-transporting ATPase subunit a
MQTQRRRFGFKRWIVLALIVLQFVIASYVVPPIKPLLELAPEAITPTINLGFLGEVALTNSILTVLIADLILILAAIGVSRGFKDANSIPAGVAGFFEPLVEGVDNLVESVSGRWSKNIFPWVATILFLVITVNLMKLVPGVESIGWMHEVHDHGGYDRQQIGPVSILAVPETGGGTGHYHVVPFFRPASTDLNFTLSIALVAMVMVQVIGYKASGPIYFTKFFNLKPFVRMWAREKLGAFDMLMPFIDIFVGLLELIAEFARIISFTFRLFGAMFAGAILLGVTGSLFLIAQLPFLFFEIFIGSVQAFVFAMLTLVFMTMATQHHGEHEEHEAAAAH